MCLQRAKCFGFRRVKVDWILSHTYCLRTGQYKNRPSRRVSNALSNFLSATPISCWRLCKLKILTKTRTIESSTSKSNHKQKPKKDRSLPIRPMCVTCVCLKYNGACSPLAALRINQIICVYGFVVVVAYFGKCKFYKSNYTIWFLIWPCRFISNETMNKHHKTVVPTKKWCLHWLRHINIEFIVHFYWIMSCQILRNRSQKTVSFVCSYDFLQA